MSHDDKALCNKVKNVFIAAGQFITATLNLKSPITVDAQFFDFCIQNGDCGTETVILGAAKPSRMIPHPDADGKIRLYPQALYKQLNVPTVHPEMGQSEITAIFNSRMNYWFNGDPMPMSERQVDLLYVVIHELTHGLGFTNSWNDYFNIQALTPAVGNISNGSTTQAQFFEFIFDKSIILLQSGTPLTSITDQLNQFQINPTLSDQDLINSFQASPQFPIAQNMYKNGVTHSTMGFLFNSDIPLNTPLSQDQIQNDVLVLETSLNPFQPSSSIGHVDFDTYVNTADFLMMFTYPPGKTLDQMMSNGGSAKTTGPMGPKLRQLLGVLGYDVKKDYTPPTINITSNSSLTSFNLVFSLICILLTFINWY
ncbi:hypothetical protein C1645_301519 [Glomus cerebriforme]|uniref:Integrase catalytic domain-containing protein n=1 Tax=Glomus cerebriforme TaxID=658196 RepID=A0A397STE9_9GLOM|nr:hypothetical protein C1645_301519 [Glomus cerebriforme]